MPLATTSADIPVALRPSRPHNARLPYLILLVLITMLWFPEPLALPGGMSVATPVMFASVLIACQSAPLAPELDRFSKHTIAGLLLISSVIVFWSTLSIFDAADPFRAGRVLLTHFCGVSILILIFVSFTQERGRQMVSFLVALAALMSAVSLAGYFDADLYKVLFGDTDRSRGFFKHSNQFGMVLGAIAPVALITMLSLHRARLWRFALVILLIIGLIASGSKTNLIIFGITGCVSLFISPLLEQDVRRRVAQACRNMGVALVVGIAATASLFFLNPRALLLIDRFFSGNEEVASIASRELIWEYSWNQFLQNPLLGQGAGQMIDVFGNGEVVPHSHNVILDYMRMLGVPGLCAVVTLLAILVYFHISTIIKALRTRNAEKSDRVMIIGLCMGGLAYIMSNMLSDSFGPSTSPFFWLITYLALFMRRSLNRVQAADEVRPSVSRYRSAGS